MFNLTPVLGEREKLIWSNTNPLLIIDTSLGGYIEHILLTNFLTDRRS